jgi:hypothetical protein
MFADALRDLPCFDGVESRQRHHLDADALSQRVRGFTRDCRCNQPCISGPGAREPCDKPSRVVA